MDTAEANERFQRANSFYRAGHYEDALVELQVLIRHQPDNVGVVDALARTLEHLGRLEEALPLFERLVNQLGYEKARLRLERVLEKLGQVPVNEDQDDEVDGQDLLVESSGNRFRIKPVRLLLLLAILAGMYVQYLPYWLGCGLIAGYFLVKYMIKAAFVRLFTIPFRMKGKALSGATAQVHGYEWTSAPERTGDGNEDEEPSKTPLRYVWLDVTITPPFRTGGFTHWEPGELMLAPFGRKYRGLDDMDHCFRIHEIRYIRDGHSGGGVLDGPEEVEDQGSKVFGPHRLKLLAGVPHDQNRFKFAYYFEAFGDIALM